MAILIAVDGTKREVKPAGKTFKLAEMYRLIGGDCDTVEAIGLAAGRTVWLDEEGKYRTPLLAVNDVATDLLHAAGGIPWDAVVGSVLVTNAGEIE